MRWRDLLPPTPAIAVALLLAAYVFVNATWSADPTMGLRKAALYASLVVMTFAAAQGICAFDNGTLRRAALFFAAGAFLGAVFVLIELLTHGLMTSTVINRVALLHPTSPKHLQIKHGQITAMDLDQLNHNVGLVMFNLWPGLLALSSLKRVMRTITKVIFFVTLAVVVMISDHNSSQVALVGSSLVVMAMWRWPRHVIRTLAAAWCVSFVLIIPASFAAYQSGLHFATWLPDTARARVIIWEYTAEQVLKHPLLGVGVASTPVLTDQQRAAGPLEKPEGFVYPRTLGSHAHDMFLQTWFELGAMGAILLAIVGVTVVMLIPLLPTSAHPFAAGTFATFALVAAFSWGVWQMWFMCAIALLPLCLRIASTTVDTAQRNCDEAFAR